MDQELDTLVLKYKNCLEKLSEINTKVEKVHSSEQVIANHLNTTNNNSNNPDKINIIFSKLKLDVDTVLNRRIQDVNTAKINVELYINTTLWNLFSRTELNNNTMLFNNDPQRVTDKKILMEMMTTLLEMDKLQELQQDDKEIDEFSKHLHEWIVQITTVYLHLCNLSEKKNVLQLLTSTFNISAWAIPLIQFNDLRNIHDFIDILNIVFEGKLWLEEDYISVLDQLAIDFTFNKLVIESSSVKVLPEDENDLHSDTLFSLCQQITSTLIKAIQQLSKMKTLVKRLSQIILHISLLLVESISNEKNCQDQLDDFISQLVFNFYDLKIAWFILPNIPFKALSIDALWDVTMYLLQIKMKTKPIALDQVLNENLPNITRFQYALADNQTQGFFMLSCLANIVTCIPSGVDEISSIHDSNKNTISACIITIISYTLFTIAFVDKNLREIFYKDVRDNFGPICRSHTFIISLLFRWTVQNISVMERMALYLFHSLDLNHWVILNDDLKLLHKLLSQDSSSTLTQQTAQIQLAKYVIEHLNYGYLSGSVDSNVSKSQPWHHRKLPVLGYDIHEEIAFILLDACQKFQPLPDTTTPENKGAIELVGTVTSAVSTYLPIADQILLLKSTYTTSSTNLANDFIHWAWSIAIRLKLYDCPISSRATDIEKSITLPFLKLVLNSYNEISSCHSALIIYTAFLLSATSRHFLRFESGDGWMKLLTILKRGKPEAIIQLFSEIIPSFVYMHGDDFFNDESLIDFFKHMIELKSDPMLVKAAKNISMLHSKKRQLVTPITSTGVGMMIGSHIWQAHLIDSVSNLLDDRGQGFSYVDLVMHSWLKTVFRKPDWMWHNSYVNVMDTLCKLAFTLNRHRVVYHMLIEEQKRMELNKIATASSSPRITRFIKTMIPVSEGVYPSLLIGEWSVLNLKANTFNKSPGIENQFFWFAFEALVMETVIEKDPYRDELIQVITSDQHPSPFDVNSLYKLTTTQKKPIEFFSIYRWLQHILVLPVHHVLAPLYLQMFFSLYYQRVNDKISLGSLFFDKKPELITRLRDYIASVQTYYGQKMSGNTILNAEVLQQTFYSMWLWLGNVDLLLPEIDVRNLPSHYDVNRLMQCHANTETEQPWLHVDRYWMDLIDSDKLELDFLQYPWQGSSKFRMQEDEPTSNSIIDDSISLSTTIRKQRFITNESNIVPLPSVTLNEPIV